MTERTGARVPGGWRPLVRGTVLTAWIVSCFLFLIWARARSFSLGYHLAEAKSEHRRLSDEGRALTLELTSLSAPERIRGPGTEAGLRAPKPEEVVALPAPEPTKPSRGRVKP